MKILHITNSMNPAYGGLSAYIHSLVPALTEIGHHSEIISLDSPAEPFLNLIPVTVHAFGPVRHGYGYASLLGPWLKLTVKNFDAVIVHGLWQYHGLAAYRALSPAGSPPCFVFSHGMLDPWFKRQYPLKHIKKWFYWWLAERRVLHAAAAVLFTCEEEKRLAHQSFTGSSYRGQVVAFGTAAPPDDATGQCEAFLQKYPGLRGQPFWLFLGRLHLKKGADLLVKAYATLAAEGLALPRLVIAGPCADDAYLNELKSSAAALGPEKEILWTGMLSGNVKWGALRTAEIFVLPSHQENFGIAVVEALACGTPVLISDQVNIWREITEAGAGLAEADTAEGTLRLLRRWLALDPQRRAAMRSAAILSFNQRYEIGAVARSLVATLQDHAPARSAS